MLVRLQSFAIGVTIAAVFLGLVYFVYGVFASGEDGGLNIRLPTPIPNLPSQNALTGPQITAANATPAVAASASATATTQPGATPVPTTLPDRTNCNEIASTGFRSGAERVWYEANCATPPTQTPAPSGPPSSIASAMQGLINEYAAVAVNFAVYLNAPALQDGDWRNLAIAAILDLQRLNGAVDAVAPPLCLAAAHAALLGARSEIQQGISITIAALNQFGGDLLQTASQHLAAGRNELAAAAQQLNAASC